MSASAGRVLIIPRGDYNSATTYNMLDMVYYGGKSYICKQTSTGNDPTNTVYWQIMLDGASEFSALSDVEFNNLQDGDGIYYDSTAQKWKNTSPVGIQVTTPPATTDYIVGDILDLTGIVVSAMYSSGTARNITTECTFSPANGATLTSSNTTITITWRTFSTTQAISVVNPVYGVDWDGSSSPAMTRTDGAVGFADPNPYYPNMTGSPSSPFDNIMPWSGMEIVEDADAGTLVKIPKFWYKLSQTQAGVGLKVQVANIPMTGFSVSPAHMDRGDGQGERDFVYIGRYKCGATAYKSVTGQTPKVSIDMGTARTAIHNLGSKIWQQDFTTRFSIWLLYIVEYANWDSQLKIGVGGLSGFNVDSMGYTDSMPYHTGTMVNNRDYGLGTQYRHIEGLWDNGLEWLDGAKNGGNNGFMIELNPADYVSSASIISTGKVFSTNCPTSFVINETTGLYPLFLPDGGNGNDYTIGMCDQWNYSKTVDTLQCGSNSGTAPYGMFYIASATATQTSNSRGTRLVKLP